MESQQQRHEEKTREARETPQQRDNSDRGRETTLSFSLKTPLEESAVPFPPLKRSKTTAEPLQPPVPPLPSLTLSSSTDPRISERPEEYFTHFSKLKSSNRRGQTRYRCRTCQHEFECSGKIRRIQHILGHDLAISKEKNVRSCPKPHWPLKESLLRLYRTATGETGRTQQPNNNRGARQPHKTAPPLLQPYATPSLSLSSATQTTRSQLTRPTPPLTLTLPSCASSSSDHSEDSDDLLDLFFSQEEETGEADEPSPSPVDWAEQQANRLLVQFLSRYHLPLSSVEDPLFLTMVQTIAATPPDFKPTLPLPQTSSLD